MFCSECGVEATGKFCWSCGKALLQQGQFTVVRSDEQPPAPTSDWSEIIDCQTLLTIPQVHDRIAQHAARAKKKFSAEDLLACCDKVATPLTGGVPFTLIAKIAQPISERLGLKTARNRVERFGQRPGTVLVEILCSLAQNSQRIREVQQAESSCTILAAIPSDIWTMRGDLVVSVSAGESVTTVDAGLTIPGQVYAWGKCERVLARLFDDLGQLAKAA